MLTTELINPQIISALAKCGHGDKILILDANYPIVSKSGNAEKIYLALSRDCPTATKVLEVLKTVINFEKMELMVPDDGPEPAIFAEYKEILPECDIEEHSRYEFYDACCEDNVKVAILSGESRVYANILLTIGVA